MWSWRGTWKPVQVSGWGAPVRPGMGTSEEWAVRQIPPVALWSAPRVLCLGVRRWRRGRGGARRVARDVGNQSVRREHGQRWDANPASTYGICGDGSLGSGSSGALRERQAGSGVVEVRVRRRRSRPRWKGLEVGRQCAVGCALLCRWAAGPLGRWAAGPLGPLGRWAAGPLGRWAAGPLGRWAAGPLGRWAAGPLGRWGRWQLYMLGGGVVSRCDSRVRLGGVSRQSGACVWMPSELILKHRACCSQAGLNLKVRVFPAVSAG